MKKILLIISVLVVITTAQAQTTSASGNTQYFALSTFNGGTDTLTYLTRNFDTNKSFYIGKPLKVLLSDLEVPILHFLSIDNGFNGSFVKSVILFYNKDKDINIAINNRQKTVRLSIDFEVNVPYAEVQKYEQKRDQAYSANTITADTEWSVLGKYFYGGRIIKDIQVVNN